MMATPSTHARGSPSGPSRASRRRSPGGLGGGGAGRPSGLGGGRSRRSPSGGGAGRGRLPLRGGAGRSLRVTLFESHPPGRQDMSLHRLPTGITLTPPLPSLYHQVTEVTPSSRESKTWKRAMDMSRPPYGQVGHLERGKEGRQRGRSKREVPQWVG
jgi:hypothetical protein